MTIDKRLVEVDQTNPTYLLVSSKNEPLAVVPLKVGASVFVGAGSNCKVQLNDESVQQLHCMFQMGDDGVLKVQDWNTGATYLNGQLVSDETEMQSGDMVRVGGSCFTAVLDADFHQGVAVDLLAGASEKVADKPDAEPDAESKPEADVEDKQAQTLEPDDDEPVAELSPDDNSNSEGEKVIDQTSVQSFQNEIETDSRSDGLANAFEELPADLATAFESGDVDGDNDISQLLMQVEQLRLELVDRDAQILAFKSNSLEPTSADENSATVKLVEQLEDLLTDIQTSDDRIKSLEDQLCLSQEANEAGSVEREQMEKWVSEIENRIRQQELESQAKVDRLVKQLKVAKEDTVVLQTQLHSMSLAGAESDKQAEAVVALNEKVEQLRVSLQQANEKNQELLERPTHSENEAELRTKLNEAEAELAKLRLEASQDRAETSRRRAELENMRAELERSLSQPVRGDDAGDSRIRAMREHLQDIHKQEQATKAEQQASGLGGRIANLLSRLQ